MTPILYAGVYEVKGGLLNRLRSWASSIMPNLAHTQEKLSTIKDFLINMAYVPKLHMQRMISIRVKPNSSRLSSRFIL